MGTPMWGGPVTRQQLCQTISLCWTLNEFPDVSRENDLPSQIGSTHCLTLAREKEITSNLAFLSAISNNSLRVMAVCIEEHPTKDGITIRVASNTGDLATVTSGLRSLATVLQQAATRVNTRNEDTRRAFREIVRLDLGRILSRLRSKHARKNYWKAGKPVLITQLNEALQIPSLKFHWKGETSKLEFGRERARSLQALFIKLENRPHISAEAIEVLDTVEDIVKVAHDFMQEFDLKGALEPLDNNSMDPSTKSHLPEALGKLSRYYSTASELVYAARDRKCRVFQNVRVESFQIQVPKTIEENFPDCQAANLPRLITDLPPNQAKKAGEKLRRHMDVIRGYRKIHAEIQLLFFYELHPDLPRPRIICSSKSACYLCNLFFQLHGGFQVPRTHGRLYDKWLLPDWLDIPEHRQGQFRDIIRQLKTALDNESAKALVSKKKRRCDPNESVLLPLAYWTPSTLSRISSSGSTSTIRPQSSPFLPHLINGKSVPLTSLPLTPPLSPQEPLHNLQPAKDAIENIILPKQSSNITLPSSTKPKLTIQHNISLLSIPRNEFPYSQRISLATPSLHLQLDKLSITLDFIQVLSGHLSITQLENHIPSNEVSRTVDTNDIPTSTELQLDCPKGSNRLGFQLRNHRKEKVEIVFVWDEVGDGETV